MEAMTIIKITLALYVACFVWAVYELEKANARERKKLNQ
jgi:hypothetical protein